jgi:peptidoglycan/xylan/chitin deacetylase (PgdA/CDA1 family)
MAPVYTSLSRPPRNGITPLVAIALLLVGAALTAIVWGLGSGPTVTVDGTARQLAPGSTIADLAGDGYTQAKSGTLYTINGGIAKLRGGDPADYERNGRPVPDSQRVYLGDVITSTNGSDRTERIVTSRTSIDPTATIVGTGPILRVSRAGKPGVMLVRKGEVSGQIASSKVLVPAENIIITASSPTSADKLVALTFDDGPWPESTLAIVKILKDEAVPGTFFELGQQVKRTPQLTAAVAAAGNVVGNHSWSHPFLTKMKAPAVRKQITDTATAIKDATGVGPAVFRPPYGAINRNVWAQAKATHEAVALWDVDSLDWTRPGVDKIVHNVTSNMGRASVVLMHDGGGPRAQTIAALPKVIKWLKDNGYTFVTVPQMQAAR